MLAPKTLKDTDFTDIVKVLNGHHRPKFNVIIERFKFYDCSIQLNQPIKDYIAQLKELSRTCKFGETANGAD